MMCSRLHNEFFTSRGSVDLSKSVRKLERQQRTDIVEHEESTWRADILRAFRCHVPPCGSTTTTTSTSTTTAADAPLWPYQPFLPLLPHQEVGVRFLVDRITTGPGCVLADDMGLGKTVMMAAALRVLANAGQVRRCLIVAPATVVPNWMNELSKWTAGGHGDPVAFRFLTTLDKDRPQRERDVYSVLRASPSSSSSSSFPEVRVVVTTYGIVRNDVDILRGIASGRDEVALHEKKKSFGVSPTLGDLPPFRDAVVAPSTSSNDNVRRGGFDLVVLDEAHTIRSPSSDIYRCAIRLNAWRRVCLTGTPVMNQLGDLWSLMSFIDPGVLGLTHTEFRQLNAQVFRSNERDSSEALRDAAAQRLEEVLSAASPLVLRREKAAVLVARTGAAPPGTTASPPHPAHATRTHVDPQGDGAITVSLIPAVNDDDGEEEGHYRRPPRPTATPHVEAIRRSFAIAASSRSSRPRSAAPALPPKQELIVWVSLSGRQQHHYLRLLTHFSRASATASSSTLSPPSTPADPSGTGGPQPSPLVLLTTLKKVCDHPWLNLPADGFQRHLSFLRTTLAGGRHTVGVANTVVGGMSVLGAPPCSSSLPPTDNYGSILESNKLMVAVRLILRGVVSPSPSAAAATAVAPNEAGALPSANDEDALNDVVAGSSVRRSGDLPLARCVGERWLVLSHSKRFLDLVEFGLRFLHGQAAAAATTALRVFRVDGSVPVQRRAAVLATFAASDANDICVALVTTQVGGVGLTVTAATRVIVLDPSWNPATEAQAVDRVHRIGQTKPVHVYRLVTCGTVEEKAYRNQIVKLMAARQSSATYSTGLGVASHPMPSWPQESQNAMTSNDAQGRRRLQRFFTRLQLRSMFDIPECPDASVTARQLRAAMIHREVGSECDDDVPDHAAVRQDEDVLRPTTEAPGTRHPRLLVDVSDHGWLIASMASASSPQLPTPLDSSLRFLPIASQPVAPRKRPRSPSTSSNPLSMVVTQQPPQEPPTTTIGPSGTADDARGVAAMLRRDPVLECARRSVAFAVDKCRRLSTLPATASFIREEVTDVGDDFVAAGRESCLAARRTISGAIAAARRSLMLGALGDEEELITDGTVDIGGTAEEVAPADGHTGGGFSRCASLELPRRSASSAGSDHDPQQVDADSDEEEDEGALLLRDAAALFINDAVVRVPRLRLDDILLWCHRDVDDIDDDDRCWEAGGHGGDTPALTTGDAGDIDRAAVDDDDDGDDWELDEFDTSKRAIRPSARQTCLLRRLVDGSGSDDDDDDVVVVVVPEEYHPPARTTEGTTTFPSDVRQQEDATTPTRVRTPLERMPPHAPSTISTTTLSEVEQSLANSLRTQLPAKQPQGSRSSSRAVSVTSGKRQLAFGSAITSPGSVARQQLPAVAPLRGSRRVHGSSCSHRVTFASPATPRPPARGSLHVDGSDKAAHRATAARATGPNAPSRHGGPVANGGGRVTERSEHRAATTCGGVSSSPGECAPGIGGGDPHRHPRRFSVAALRLSKQQAHQRASAPHLLASNQPAPHLADSNRSASNRSALSSSPLKGWCHDDAEGARPES